MSYRTSSTLGSATFLVVIGAILTYAVTATISGIDLSVVGAILMIAGVALFVFGAISAISERSSHVTSTTVQRTTDDGRVVSEREVVGR